MIPSQFKSKKIALVFAHPDDEVLFGCSMVQSCSKIIFCFSRLDGDQIISDGRKKIRDSYPLEHAVFLEEAEPKRLAPIDEFNSWRFPEDSESGINSTANDINYQNHKTFEKLMPQLEKQLREIDLVITHNPWGEYGHPHHVLINKLISKIATKMNFEIYVPGVFSLKSKHLMSMTSHKLSIEPVIVKVDEDIARNLKALYVNNDCWTWSDEKPSPSFNIFYKLNEKNFLRLNENHDNNYFSEHFLQFIDKPYRIHTLTEFILMTKFGFLVEIALKLKRFFIKNKIKPNDLKIED